MAHQVNELLNELPSKRLLLRYLAFQSQLDGVHTYIHTYIQRCMDS